ncbi:uncharacterized protein FA14DRAFT_159790 [Meira miltonrushii]|uniref:Rad21/Rec8-like protein N-terminal domain-containing protein n=1 Tax=Meira miltonrushii TaxID=1280837 RepID=A0A316VK88_9BASI|nr:uncharacterized protein FA14DRAFT_159790 [Meira miltonrushii]PWN38019.1 hypothetical protein FA14DRAFT_159790 [Meira miltonrushii]
MFYSDVILSKRGPLAKVWLAAHAERKLTKSQLLQTDIEQTVSSIIGPDVVPMALRLSGQLLLGVVRIYSRKTKYLLEDCNDAVSKLKTAFRSGAIDFTADSAAAAAAAGDVQGQQHNNVTLPNTRTAYDLALPDPALEGWDAESSVGGDLSSRRSIARSDRYTARPEDITLRRYFDPAGSGSARNSDSFGWASGEFFDPDASNGEFHSPRPDVLQRRDSQGRLIDENGDLILEGDDDASSIGIGRDAQMQMGGARPSLTAGDLTGFDSLGMDDFMMADDLAGGISGAGEGGLDLGLEEFDAQRRSMTPVRDTRSSSVRLENLSPRTTLRVQQAAEKRAQAAQRKRKQIIDSRTQLDDSTQRRQITQGTAGIVLAEPSFLPAKRSHLHLLELQADPIKGVLPFSQADNARQIFHSARTLAPELSKLFTVDASALLRRRTELIEDVAQAPARPQKRIRAEGEEEEQEDDFASEIGRRAVDTQMQLGAGADLTFESMDDYDPFANQPEGEISLGPGGFDLGEDPVEQTQTGLRRSQRKRPTNVQEDLEAEEERRRRTAFQQEGDLGRLGTPEEGSIVGSSYEDVSPTPSYPLRAFDAPAAGDVTAASSASAVGMSRNTLRAIKVLKTQLSPEDEEEGEMQFSEVTKNASRRAASAFFFEILALGTKDCLRVDQEDPFGEIKIKAKPGLWSMQRSGSVAV